MPRVSPKPLKPFVKKDIIREFWYTLGELNTKEIYSLFKEMFTPTEILMLAKRLAILRALREGIDYESIGKEFQVTYTTISKMNALLMKLPDEGLRIIDKMVSLEKMRWEKFKRSGLVKGGKLVFPKKR